MSRSRSANIRSLLRNGGQAGHVQIIEQHGASSRNENALASPDKGNLLGHGSQVEAMGSQDGSSQESVAGRHPGKGRFAGIWRLDYQLIGQAFLDHESTDVPEDRKSTRLNSSHQLISY